MTSYIGLALKTVYLVLIGFSVYNFSAVAKLFNTKKIIFTLIAINVLLSFSTLRKGHDWGDDFSLYIAQAKVICEGGFEQLKSQQLFTQTNAGYQTSPDFYPWGFPALIAPAYKIFGFNLTAFKVFTFAWFPLLLWLLFVSFKNELRDKTFYYIALFALSPVIFEFRDSIGSDIPFMFFSILGILLIRRVVSEKEIIFNEAFSYSLLGIVIFFSYSVRTTGIVLLPTLLFTQLYEFFFNRGKLQDEKRKQILLHLIPYFLFSILFAVYYKLTGYSDYSYTSQFDWKFFYYQLRFNFFYYLKIPSEFFHAPVLSEISSLFWGIILFFVLWGITGLKKKDVSLFLYLIFMYGLLLLTPFHAFRYIFPVLPVVFYFLINGITSLENAVNKKYFSSLFFVPVLLFFFYGTLTEVATSLINREKYIEGPFDKEGLEVFEFIRNNTSEKDVIVFYKPRALRLLTGRNGFVVKTVSQIIDGRGNFLVIHKNAPNDSFPSSDQINSIKNHLHVVFENADFSVYSIAKDW